jgi:hypothetical protein
MNRIWARFMPLLLEIEPLAAGLGGIVLFVVLLILFFAS